MSEQEILDALAANDLKSIRALLEFVWGGSGFDYINDLHNQQEALREQLRQIRGQ